MAVSAGDAFLDVHGRLAAGFGGRLSRQVQGPAGLAGERAGHHFGRRFAHGLKTAAVVIGAGLAAATVVAVRGILTATKAASDLNETVNKTKVIFGGSAAEILRWSRGSAKSMGLSRQEALANAAAFGDMFLQLKLGRPQAVGMSKRMVQLAADFASFHNADISDVLLAQQSAFRGEFDALQKFVPGINAARVEQEALRRTHKASAKDLTQAEKAQAAYAIMLRDGRRASGDYARTSKDLANTQRSNKAQWQDLTASIGKVFLPVQLLVARHLGNVLLPTLQRLATKHGPAVQRALLQITRALLAALPSGKAMGEMAGRLAAKLSQLGRDLGPGLASLSTGMASSAAQTHLLTQAADLLRPTLAVVGVLMRALADHTDLLAKALPFLVAGYGLYRVAQATANLAAAAEVVLMPARIASTFVLARAIRSLGTAQAQAGSATVVNTAIQRAATGATGVGTLTLLRQRAAVLATAAASKLARVATIAWTAVQWLLNAALTANPIGLVIVAVAALVAGVVIAYKRSETFRRIVDAVFRWLRTSVPAALRYVGGLVAGWARGIIGWALDIRARVLAAFTRLWGALKDGARAFVGTFGAIWDKVSGRIKAAINVGLGIIRTFLRGVEVVAGKLGLTIELTDSVPRLQRGGTVPGSGSGDKVGALLEPGEVVIPNRAADRRRLFRQAGVRKRLAGLDLGGDLASLRLHMAAGGLVPRTTGLVGRVQQFMRSVDPLPYVWGAVGPHAYDCSGLASEIVNRLTGRPSYRRLFTTASIGPGVVGLRPGRGTFTIGTTAGSGHMAANLAGFGAEARGTASGILTGSAARSVTSFARQFYLPQIGGNFVNTGGFSLLSLLGRLLGAVTGPARAALRRVAGGSLFGRLVAAGGTKLLGAGTDWLKQGVGFDTGGVLQPGATLALNRTGAPELVSGPGLPDQVAAAVAAALHGAAVELDGTQVGQLVVAPHLRDWRRMLRGGRSR